MTYKEAIQAHLNTLLVMGWTVSPYLKVPHATSPDGKTRLWFKPQAVLAGYDSSMSNARSLLWLDMRTCSTLDLIQAGIEHANFLATR